MNIGPYQNETPPQRVTLANGTVILTVPVASAHSVTLGAWLRRGSQDEPAGLGGLAHFLEHMVFKGSRRRSAFDLARLFDSVGASVDAFTTKDHVAFTAKVLPEYFAPTAEALADMILDPAFDPDLVALEQDVVVEEIQEVLDTPEDLLHDAFTARLYGGHPRGRPILGTPASVRGLDADLLRREHADLFCGSSLVVAVAGNVRPGMTDGLCACFELAGAAPPRKRAPAAVADDEVGILFDGAEVRDDRLVIDSPVQQCYFEIGNQAVSYLHPDRVPLAMLSNILGGGLSSRVFQAVREREGLAYSVFTYIDMGRDVGLVSCSGSCSPSKLSRLEAVVRGEYRAFLRDGVGEDELADTRAQIKSQLIFSLEGGSNQMGRAAKDEIFFGRFIPTSELVGEIDAVGRDDIMRCARTYFDPDRLLTAVHGPATA